MKIEKNILNGIMYSENIPTEYAKVLYDWEVPEGAPNTYAFGYVFNNLLEYSDHHVPENIGQLNISAMPGRPIFYDTSDLSLILSLPPSGNFNGNAVMQIGNKVEYKDWTFFLNFEEAAGESSTDLNKARVLVSSMQNTDSESGFMVGINGGGQLFFESDGVPLNLQKKLERKNLISVSYYDSTNTLTLGIYDPIEKAGTYKSYNVNYTTDERWYIGGTLSDLTNDDNYKQFNGYVDNFLLLSGYLNAELSKSLSDVFFLTGFKRAAQLMTPADGLAPTGYVETQELDGEMVTGTSYVPVAGVPGAYEEVPLMGPQYKTVGTYQFDEGGGTVNFTESAFVGEEREYNEAYIQSYAPSGSAPLLAGDNIQPFNVHIKASDGYIELGSMRNDQEIQEGNSYVSAKSPTTTELNAYRGISCDTAQYVYFYAPCQDQVTIGENSVVSLIPIIDLYSPARPLDGELVTSDECSRKSEQKVTLCAHNITIAQQDALPSALEYVYYSNINSSGCSGWPCPGVTTTTTIEPTATTTTTADPNAYVYHGYECSNPEGPVSFVDKNLIANNLAGYPDSWMTGLGDGTVIKVRTGDSIACLSGSTIERITQPLHQTYNYLPESPAHSSCEDCNVTTTPPPTTTTLPPKLCDYDIEASLAWANGLDIDIYVKKDGGSCSGDQPEVLYWGQMGNDDNTYGRINLVHDAHATCLPITEENPGPPEVISGKFTEPETFRVWWNRHSICVPDDYVFLAGETVQNASPEWESDGEPSITITNNIVPTDPVTNESLTVKITAYQASLGQNSSLISIGATDYGLTPVGSNWEGVFTINGGQELKIKDIPQVLNSSNQNIGGDQKNWADGVKIEIYGCDCQLLSNIEGGAN